MFFRCGVPFLYRPLQRGVYICMCLCMYVCLNRLMFNLLVPSFLSWFPFTSFDPCGQNSSIPSFSLLASASQEQGGIRQQWLPFSPDFVLPMPLFFYLALLFSTISFLPILFFPPLLSFASHLCLFTCASSSSALLLPPSFSFFPHILSLLVLLMTTSMSVFALALTHFECLPYVPSVFITSAHCYCIISPFKAL